MGKQKPFDPVKLFCGVIYKNPHYYQESKDQLTGIYGSIDIESEEILFDMTVYYNDEMGFPLFRRFVSFEKLIDPQSISDIKLKTNLIENAMSVDDQRTVNIDPGFLSPANVIIATTKNYYHRVPLANGIYAHIEYVIKRKKIFSLEWTYPDFKKVEYITFFDNLRRLYQQQMSHK